MLTTCLYNIIEIGNCQKGENVIAQRTVSSRILYVPVGSEKLWDVWFLYLLQSQYSHSTPTQLEMFFQRGPAAASFHFECLSCCLRVLNVGCGQDQQMVRRWYPAPCHQWYRTVYFAGYQETLITRSRQWAVVKLLWQAITTLCALWHRKTDDNVRQTW